MIYILLPGVLQLYNNQLILTKKLVYGITKNFEILLETKDNGKPNLSLQVSRIFSLCLTVPFHINQSTKTLHSFTKSIAVFEVSSF